MQGDGVSAELNAAIGERLTALEDAPGLRAVSYGLALTLVLRLAQEKAAEIEADPEDPREGTLEAVGAVVLGLEPFDV